jgi:hypothetical protein
MLKALVALVGAIALAVFLIAVDADDRNHPMAAERCGEAEVLERLDRLQDALGALRSAEAPLQGSLRLSQQFPCVAASVPFQAFQVLGMPGVTVERVSSAPLADELVTSIETALGDQALAVMRLRLVWGTYMSLAAGPDGTLGLLFVGLRYGKAGMRSLGAAVVATESPSNAFSNSRARERGRATVVLPLAIARRLPAWTGLPEDLISTDLPVTLFASGVWITYRLTISGVYDDEHPSAPLLMEYDALEALIPPLEQPPWLVLHIHARGSADLQSIRSVVRSMLPPPGFHVH